MAHVESARLCEQIVLRLAVHSRLRVLVVRGLVKGRGGWGAQAQRLEAERRREVEERYNDAQDVPGAVAGGGGEWKSEHNQETTATLKRGRSPEDEGESGRGVS